jgi:hypothetical protein
VDLLVGDGSVFHARGHDQEFAFLEPDLSVPELHAEPTVHDEKQFVLVLMVCQTNSPRNLTSLTCYPFSSPTTFGLQ